MKQINIYHILCALALSLLWGCSDDVTYKVDTVDSGQKEIRLQADIDQLNLSRADDSGFADGDRIGIYAVNFGADGNPGTLASTGNLADNVRFTFNEDANSWTGDRQLYFKDESTPVDFYGYYPYMEAVDNVNAYPFSVARNQSTEASDGRLSGYEASDFLWGKTVGVTPSTPIVTVTFRHILSSVQVTLIEGEGFDEGEWASLDKSVIVSGTGRDALIDLATGTATLTGSRDNTGIIAAGYKENYRAVVIPQSVEAGEPLLDITVDGQSYQFRKTETMTYVPSKMHKFTIEVTKRLPDGTFCFELVNEAITPWESDAESHNGLAKEYLLVNIEENQTLEEALKIQKIDVSDIVNLKVTGSMREDDFYYIRDNMKKIQALNLKEIEIKGECQMSNSEFYENSIPSLALTNAVTLKHIVLPQKLVAIGRYAFGGTILEGALTIPEGVKLIDCGAFSNFWDDIYGSSEISGGKLLANSNFTGTLTLPSTLEEIGDDAFRGCNFTGALILPKSLKKVGNNAFNGCANFTGELHLPEEMIEVDAVSFEGGGAFYGMKGITGRLELPRNMKDITGFGGLNISTLVFPESPLKIGYYAFADLEVKSGIVIPESVTAIGERAFLGCTAPYIILPQSLTRVEAYSFARCKNLSDTMVIPEKVEIIEHSAFIECEKLTAIKLPPKLTHIGEGAFKNCYSLEYIHCDAVEPPLLHESAFYGVNKDNFTLEVPEQSVEAYRNAPGWKEFRRIAAYRNFVARPSKYNVLNMGGKKEIILNADAEWELASAPSWCHVDKSSGNKKSELLLTVDEMAHNSGNREGKVEFRLKGDAGYTTTIDVAQYDYRYEEDEYITLQQATKGDGIDLFFVGDGYDAGDIASDDMLEDIRQEVEYFFAVEPYTTYREYFNVYTAVALSEDSGVEDLNHWRQTKFHAVLPQTCGLRITADWGGAMNYCAEVCPPIINRPEPRVGVILLANTAIYDGVTYSMGDSFCALVTKSDSYYPYDARGLVQHEAGGHGIGWLGDEYIYHPEFIQACKCTCSGCGHVNELLAEQSSGFSLNLSLNGKYREVPWSHLIFNPSYGDIVDIYEGGYFHGRGVYRSEYNSCMNDNVPYFSTWSRQLIVQRIMKLAGEEFSLDRFYALDRRDMGRDFTSTSRSSNGVSAVGYHGNAPVFIDNYKFGKKGGRR